MGSEAPATPGYWMNETSGRLRPAIEAYLREEPLDGSQIAAIRAYLRQWMDGPWLGNGIANLKYRIDLITTKSALDEWFEDAFELNIDPL